MVQWLRLRISTAGAWVQSLVQELGSCICAAKKKKKRIICDWDAVPFLFFSEKLGKDTSVCNQKWGPTAHCPKANKEAKLVERKVCFILDAGNWGVEGGRVDNCPKADSPPTLTIRGQELLYTEGGGYM